MGLFSLFGKKPKPVEPAVKVDFTADDLAKFNELCEATWPLMSDVTIKANSICQEIVTWVGHDERSLRFVFGSMIDIGWQLQINEKHGVLSTHANTARAVDALRRVHKLYKDGFIKIKPTSRGGMLNDFNVAAYESKTWQHTEDKNLFYTYSPDRRDRGIMIFTEWKVSIDAETKLHDIRSTHLASTGPRGYSRFNAIYSAMCNSKLKECILLDKPIRELLSVEFAERHTLNKIRKDAKLKRTMDLIFKEYEDQVKTARLYKLTPPQPVDSYAKAKYIFDQLTPKRSFDLSQMEVENYLANIGVLARKCAV